MNITAQISPTESYQQRLANGQLQADAAHAFIIEKLQTLYNQLLTDDTPKGLLARLRAKPKAAATNFYIWGEVGRGKSMLMDLLVECVPESVPHRRIHYHAFMADIHHRLHANGGGEDALKPLAEAIAKDLRLLCLDEFQVTDIADAMILARLFTLLLDAGLTVITTSNRKPDDLYQNGLQREYFLKFIELVKARFKVLEVRSPHDYRMHKLKGKQAYFTPADNVAELQMIFNSLRTQTAAPHTLTVNQRNFTLPITANGMAWCRFDELCRAALGAEDYAALAAEFHTLFLVEIPQMTREDRNEAKRFVTLIDTLYEHKTRLFCTAAVPAEQLYPTGDGHFEFARTVSRLHEMGSEQYLSTSQHI
jgi:cell division protein ZapE